MIKALALACLICSPVSADIVVASRTIGSNTTLSPEDLTLTGGTVSDGFSTIDQVVGMETSVIIYAGQPITFPSLRLPTLVERNSKVALVFSINGLEIATEGRALGRASHGEQVQVLNLSSRNTVSGIATGFARVSVSPQN